jgi:chromate reductase
MKKVAVIVGSLRKESWTRKLALALIKLAPPSLNMEIVEIGQMPLFNQDLDDEGHTPPEWTTFREHLKKMNAVLFATPEYNRAIPAPIKNAIDVGSRPYGQSVWAGKPAAVISCSPGAMGGFGANHNLRQSMVFLDVPCMPQPEAYLAGINHLLNADGSIAKEETQEFLRKFMDAFAKWADKF